MKNIERVLGWIKRKQPHLEFGGLNIEGHNIYAVAGLIAGFYHAGNIRMANRLASQFVNALEELNSGALARGTIGDRKTPMAIQSINDCSDPFSFNIGWWELTSESKHLKEKPITLFGYNQDEYSLSMNGGLNFHFKYGTRMIDLDQEYYWSINT